MASEPTKETLAMGTPQPRSRAVRTKAPQPW